MISPFDDVPDKVIFPFFFKEFKNLSMKTNEKHFVFPDRVISIMKSS